MKMKDLYENVFTTGDLMDLKDDEVLVNNLFEISIQYFEYEGKQTKIYAINYIDKNGRPNYLSMETRIYNVFDIQTAFIKGLLASQNINLD